MDQDLGSTPVPEEDLNEGTEAISTAILQTLHDHFAGIAPTDVASQFESDRELFTTWIEEETNQYVEGHFLLGFLDFLVADDLTALPSRDTADGTTQRCRIHLNCPSGFESTYQEQAARFTKENMEIVLTVLNKDRIDVTTLLTEVPEAVRMAFPRLPVFDDSAVDLGKVTGKRRIGRTGTLATSDYVLNVPGGNVMVKVLWKNGQVDNEAIEPYLATLRVD